MRKLLAILFVTILSLHFICGSVNALGFLHASNSRNHIAATADLGSISSFENEEAGVETFNTLNIDFSKQIFSFQSQLFSSYNISLLDKVAVGLRCDIPLYLCNLVFLI
jgi:hypothetical protein